MYAGAGATGAGAGTGPESLSQVSSPPHSQALGHLHQPWIATVPEHSAVTLGLPAPGQQEGLPPRRTRNHWWTGPWGMPKL